MRIKLSIYKMKTGESGQSFSPKTDTVCSGKNLEEHCCKGVQSTCTKQKDSNGSKERLGQEIWKRIWQKKPAGQREKFMPMLVGQGYTDGHRSGSRTYAEFKK